MDPEQIPLRDLHLPEAIGWWPLAPGWWLLIGLLAAGVVVVARKWYREYGYNAARRYAISELDRSRSAFERDGNLVALGAQLSRLLRRTMLAYSPRSEVAGLTGRAWLSWLDQGLEDRPFTQGAGRALGDLPYRRAGPPPADVDVDGLVDAVRRRLETPVTGAGGAGW
jgi:hypothetical protein